MPFPAFCVPMHHPTPSSSPVPHIPGSKKLRLAFLLGAISLAGCAVDDGHEGELDDKSDSSAVSLRLDLGETLTNLSVVAVTSHQPSAAENRASLLPMHFHLDAGQSAAITMRASSTGFNPYLFVREVSTNTEVATSDDQIMLGSMGENDSLLTLSADRDTDYVIFASGGRLRTYGGSFSIDATAIDSPTTDLSLDAAYADYEQQRAIAILREKESRLRDYLDAGTIVEDADGHVSFVREGTPLSEYTGARNTVSAINEGRDELAALALGQSDANAIALFNRGLAPLYSVTR
ncbi:MAG: hypothetical protein GY811_04910 [Myxococcales bacterium]|nr:hypothetical protein [Myxococcales bacterium]